jgi:hypothetical protein
MKKISLTLLTLCGLASATFAGMPANAIGVRLGGGNHGGGAEVSYQKALGSANRVELDVGLGGGGLSVAGIYQWDGNITNALNWYVGPGAAIGLYSGSNIGIGVGGQLGLDFNFNSMGAPILLGLDVRPMWGLINNTGFGADGALSIRYTF